MQKPITAISQKFFLSIDEERDIRRLVGGLSRHWANCALGAKPEPLA
jgi:hypothetical protein